MTAYQGGKGGIESSPLLLVSFQTGFPGGSDCPAEDGRLVDFVRKTYWKARVSGKTDTKVRDRPIAAPDASPKPTRFLTLV